MLQGGGFGSTHFGLSSHRLQLASPWLPAASVSTAGTFVCSLALRLSSLQPALQEDSVSFGGREAPAAEGCLFRLELNTQMLDVPLL